MIVWLMGALLSQIKPCRELSLVAITRILGGHFWPKFCEIILTGGETGISCILKVIYQELHIVLYTSIRKAIGEKPSYVAQ